MRFKRKVFIKTGQPDIVPLINVVFLLLIFFMLTSGFVFQTGIRVNLPRAVTSEALYKELFVVVIDDKNGIYIDERPIDRDELVSRITLAAKGGESLLIKADKSASLASVIEIWDICRKANIRQVNIATTQ